jgi:hypothetical protein
MKTLNLTGQKFNRLTVIEQRGFSPHGKSKWLCRCECGREIVANGSDLKSQQQKSCGCLNSEMTATRNRTHGDTGLDVFKNWSGMIQRCYNPNATGYVLYGGAGIRVCELLRSVPRNLILVIGEKPSPRHSIDRFPDNKGHYSCGKCSECCRLGLKKNIRWATSAEQNRNRRDTPLLTFNGETKCLLDWAKIAGLSAPGFSRRIKAGEDPFAPKRGRWAAPKVSA